MLTKLPPKVLARLIDFLDIKDVYSLGLTCTTLQGFIFGTKEAIEQDLLFPEDDESMDDRFMHSLVPSIERHLRIERLRMVGLPLSWAGYFCIFNQFGHCVRRIDIRAPNAVLIDLTHHLLCFARRLVDIQDRYGIPIMFSQYVAETRHGHADIPSPPHSNDTLPTEKLQDPPFENLVDLQCESTSPGDGSKDIVMRLESAIWFLSQPCACIPRNLVGEGDMTKVHLSSGVAHKRKWEKNSIIPSHVNKRIRQ